MKFTEASKQILFLQIMILISRQNTRITFVGSSDFMQDLILNHPI